MQEIVTFNDLPSAVSKLLDEVLELKKMVKTLQDERENAVSKENRHKPMSVEEAADYLKMPRRTLYEKLRAGDIPASKPGKRYVLYQDEIDKWLEVNRKNPVPLTVEEENAAIMAGNKRKPKPVNW